MELNHFTFYIQFILIDFISFKLKTDKKIISKICSNKSLYLKLKAAEYSV